MPHRAVVATARPASSARRSNTSPVSYSHRRSTSRSPARSAATSKLAIRVHSRHPLHTRKGAGAYVRVVSWGAERDWRYSRWFLLVFLGIDGVTPASLVILTDQSFRAGARVRGCSCSRCRPFGNSGAGCLEALAQITARDVERVTVQLRPHRSVAVLGLFWQLSAGRGRSGGGRSTQIVCLPQDVSDVLQAGFVQVLGKLVHRRLHTPIRVPALPRE
jgi:hypothetical protein